MSFKQSCCVLFAVPVATHTKRLFLLTKKLLARMTVAVLHSYTHVLGWAYFRIGWAYFQVKGGPIFGRGVLENTPIPLFEQILNSSPMGVFSRDYGICVLGKKKNLVD